MSAHRYWRVYVNSVAAGNYVSMAEIGLYESVGGTNHALSGTMSAISIYDAGYVAAYSIDSDLDTMWHSSYVFSGIGAWLKCDLGAGNEKEIRVLTITPRRDGYYNTITSLNLEYSNDNATWFAFASADSISDWSPGVARLFDWSDDGSPVGPPPPTPSESMPNAFFATFRG